MEMETLSPELERLIFTDRVGRRWTFGVYRLLFVTLSLALDKATGRVDPVKLTVNINVAVGEK